MIGGRSTTTSSISPGTPSPGAPSPGAPAPPPPALRRYPRDHPQMDERGAGRLVGRVRPNPTLHRRSPPVGHGSLGPGVLRGGDHGPAAVLRGPHTPGPGTAVGVLTRRRALAQPAGLPGEHRGRIRDPGRGAGGRRARVGPRPPPAGLPVRRG